MANIRVHRLEMVQTSVMRVQTTWDRRKSALPGQAVRYSERAERLSPARRVHRGPGSRRQAAGPVHVPETFAPSFHTTSLDTHSLTFSKCDTHAYDAAAADCSGVIQAALFNCAEGHVPAVTVGTERRGAASACCPCSPRAATYRMRLPADGPILDVVRTVT
jgi:hypothetical protein